LVTEFFDYSCSLSANRHSSATDAALIFRIILLRWTRDQDLLDAVSTGLARDRARRENEMVLQTRGARFEELSPRERAILSQVVEGSAPICFAESTATRPTAPSPTIATALPESFFGLPGAAARRCEFSEKVSLFT
jgi:hypothetical protein